jgi:putative tryptophan/tyrosine transport system substrate-binding protein
MKRREFIAGLGGAVAWPVVARAQQGERVRRVGVLSLGEADEPPYYLGLWRDELQKLGWDEGRNLRLDVRFVGAGDIDRARAGVADLVRLAPDVIFLIGAQLLSPRNKKRKQFPSCSWGVVTLSKPGG